MTTRKPTSRYTEPGEVIERPPGEYSSDLFSDKLIECHQGDGRPFFTYLAFTVPHFPLQAPPALIEKYMGRDTDGWDAPGRRRFERMQAQGLAPPDMALPTRIAEVPDWGGLSDEARAVESKKMAIYAAMVDNLDSNVGRVLGLLKELGESDNTSFVFLSDIGTNPYDRNTRPIYAAYQE